MGERKRHNAEFIALWKKSGMTQREIANVLGVSLITVKSWCVEEGKEMAQNCPKFRVETLKIWLRMKLQDLTEQQRAEVMEILRNIW